MKHLFQSILPKSCLYFSEFKISDINFYHYILLYSLSEYNQFLKSCLSWCFLFLNQLLPLRCLSFYRRSWIDQKMGYLKFSLLKKKECNAYNTMRANAWNVFGQLQKDQQLCDMVILCQGKKFYVHRCILAGVSPYFKAVVSSNFAHDVEAGYFETDLSNFSPVCVQLFVDLIYQKPTFQASEKEHLELWRLLDFVQVRCFDHIFMEFLWGNLCFENCWTYLDVEEPYVKEDIKTIVISFITRNLDDCLAASSFKDVSKTAILKCLGSHEIFFQLSSNRIVDLILKWVNVDSNARRKEFAEILYKLRDDWMVDQLQDQPTLSSKQQFDFDLPVASRKGTLRCRDIHLNYRLSNKIGSTNLKDLVMHYDPYNTERGFPHCFVGIDNYVRKLRPLDSLANIKFSDKEYSIDKRICKSAAICCSNNSLFVAMIQKAKLQGFQQRMVLSTFDKRKKELVVKQELKAHEIEVLQEFCDYNCGSDDSDSDTEDGYYNIRLDVEISDAHYFEGIIYILIKLNDRGSTKGCSLIRFCAKTFESYGYCYNDFQPPYTASSTRIPFTAVDNHIYFIVSGNLYYIDVKEVDAFKDDNHERWKMDVFDDDNYDIAYHKNKLYAVQLVRRLKESFHFYTFNNGVWSYIFRIDVSTLGIEQYFTKYLGKMHLFSHDNSLFLNMPILRILDKRCCIEIDIDSKKPGERQFEFPEVYCHSHYISMPASVLI